MNILNMKMVVFWVNKKIVLLVQQKWNLGGDGYFGIAVIVYVYVMNRDHYPIGILIYVK